MVSTEFGIVKIFKFEQPLNILSSILLSLLGILKLVKHPQASNAPFPIVLIVFEIFILDKL